MARTTTRANTAQRPFEELRSANIKAVIWENRTQNGSMFNVELRRVYKDERDNWQETTSLGRDDLLLASHLLSKAYDVIDEELAARRKNRNAS